MMFTVQQISAILQYNHNPTVWVESINNLLPKYEINTVVRISAFFGQCGYESNDFTRLEENLNYRGDVLWKLFKHHFVSFEEANSFAHHPEMIANRIYADRLGNGNEESGDGWNFRGRGIIQITGRSNYTQFFNDEKIQSITSDYLTTPEGALRSACWFWKKNNLNNFADKRMFSEITEKINGPAKLGNELRIANIERIEKLLS